MTELSAVSSFAPAMSASPSAARPAAEAVVDMSLAAPPAQYYEHLASAGRAVHRAIGRTSRAFQVAQQDPGALDRFRLVGAVDQADEALAALAAAERYRLRNAGIVVPEARDYAVRAAREIELGTRALRRATVLVSDTAATDRATQGVLVHAIAEGERSYRSAAWLLEAAGDLAGHA